MPNTLCLVAPAFSISGTQQIVNQPASFFFEFESVEVQALILAYQWYVNGNLVINKNQPTFTEQMPVGSYTVGGRLLTAEGWSGIKTIFFEILEQNITPIGNFDYMAVYFKWAQGAGTDLDIKVGFENTGTIHDANYVGYNEGNVIVPDNTTDPGKNSYLWWASDSVGTSGTEAVLIGIEKFIENNPTTSNIIEIALYAGWHNLPPPPELNVPVGSFTVELISYLGGTMTINSNNSFVNTGGVLTGIPRTIESTVPHTNPKSYKKVGIIKYNKTSKLAQLQTL